MPKAYSYTRMSTPEQLKGDSRRRQETRAARYAEDHGLEVVDRFDDFGVSAFHGKNAEIGALSEFTRMVDEGVIERGSYLLVESMDRLTRQTVPRAMSLLLGLTDRGINVAILDDNKVYSDSGNQEDTFALMSALVSMCRAHDESRRKSSMLSEAWKNKRALARTTGKITTSKIPGWLKIQDGRIEVIPERVAVVKEIFEWTKGGYGAYSIARRLNRRGESPWSTRRNAVWQESYIKKILKSRTVLGEYQPHVVQRVNGKVVRTPDGNPLPGYYPAIVPLILYQEANAAIDQRRTTGRGRKGSRYANLFTGLLRCQCGGGYRYIDKGSKGGSYLQCSVSFAKGNCSARAIRYKLFESIVLDAVDKLDWGALLGGRRLSTRVRALQEQRSNLVEQLQRREREAENVVAAIKQGGATSHRLAVELSQLESSIDAARAAMDDVDRELDELSRLDPGERKAQLRRLMAYLESASGEDRNEKRRALAGELQRLVRKIVVGPSTHLPVEVIDEHPDWKRRYKVKTERELEHLCLERWFDISLTYRTGDTIVVDAMDGVIFSAEASFKMKSMQHRLRRP